MANKSYQKQCKKCSSLEIKKDWFKRWKQRYKCKCCWYVFPWIQYPNAIFKKREEIYKYIVFVIIKKKNWYSKHSVLNHYGLKVHRLKEWTESPLF